MREIGLIKHVQLQRSSLKQGQRPQRYYDPAPLLVVERLLLAPGGVSAVSADGEPIPNRRIGQALMASRSGLPATTARCAIAMART
jgi:hypothetical protein